jgi:hypothetical protein
MPDGFFSHDHMWRLLPVTLKATLPKSLSFCSSDT